MHFLYVLRSTITHRHYIGITAELEKRLGTHNNGSVRSTKPYRPWKLVHTETFCDKKEARKREIFLKKTARARTELYQKVDGPFV